MRIEPLLSERNCLVMRDAPTAEVVFARVAEAAAAVLGRADAEEIRAGLEAREAEVPTTTPEGVAFPHTVIPGLERPALVVAAIDPPVRVHAMDSAATSLVMCLVGSREQPFEHVRLLARLARVVRSPEARARLASAGECGTLLARLIEEDRSHG